VNLITDALWQFGENSRIDLRKKKMSVSASKTTQNLTGSAAAGKGGMHGGDGDFGAFSLRDTLNGIVVREANFSEFLAALKSFGMQPTRQ
jgi:hypothetical protein